MWLVSITLSCKLYVWMKSFFFFFPFVELSHIHACSFVRSAAYLACHHSVTRYWEWPCKIHDKSPFYFYMTICHVLCNGFDLFVCVIWWSNPCEVRSILQKIKHISSQRKKCHIFWNPWRKSITQSQPDILDFGKSFEFHLSVQE